MNADIIKSLIGKNVVISLIDGNNMTGRLEFTSGRDGGYAGLFIVTPDGLTHKLSKDSLKTMREGKIV